MSFQVLDLGRMGFSECEGLQGEILERVISGQGPNTLVLVEHPPVITLGANFHEKNVLRSREELREKGIEVFRTDRGGDVTFHGPGQLVAYPIFSLDLVNRDLHRWLRTLEEAVLATVKEFGLEGRRFAPHTGVWIGDEKVCAIGVKIRKWVSKHGLALNCDVDLRFYEDIIPCGIEDYPVTSLSRASGRVITVEDAKPVLVESFANLFGRYT